MPPTEEPSSEGEHRENPAQPLSDEPGARVSGVAIAVGAVIAAGAFFLLRPEAPPPGPPPPVAVEPPPGPAPPPQAPAPPAPGPVASAAELPANIPAVGPFCDEMIGLYEAAQKRLGCAWSQKGVAMTVCRAPFERKPACIDELQRASLCLKAVPPSAWVCDAMGNLVLTPTQCKSELETFATCINE